MKIGLLTLIALFAFSLSSNAQTDKKVVKPKTPKEKTDLCKEVENTYQIVANDSRSKFSVTTDVCEIVKRERQKDKTIIYKINDLYSLKIYSEKDILTIKLPLQYIIYKEN